MGFYRFTIPTHHYRFGGRAFAVHKECVVQTELLPVMAAIIDAATRPSRLTQEYVFNQPRSVLAEGQREHLGQRVRYDLEHALREEAKKLGRCIVTAITFEETADDSGVLFIASAMSMPLIEVPEGTQL